MNPDIKKWLSLALFLNFCIMLVSKYPDSSLGYLSTNKFEDAPYCDWKSSAQWEELSSKLLLSVVYESITNEDNYCEKVAEYRRNNPIKFDHRGLPIKEHRIFHSSYKPPHIIGDKLTSYGTISKPKYLGSKKDGNKIFDPAITFFYTHKASWHKYHEPGKHYLCEGQRYNHIPGNIWLNYKDVIVDNLREYAKHYEGREHCFDPWEIIPFTLNLKHSDQCSEFMNILETQLNSNEIKWMIKKSRFSHGGKGVFVLDSSLAQTLMEEFECPAEDMFLAQSYIRNPMLIDGRKFDFRVYLIVASMDPLIILYGNGFIRLSLEQYDPESSDKNVHLTNTKVAKDKLKEMDHDKKEEILNDQSWTLEQLEDYMIEKGLANTGWLDNTIKPFLKKMMLHLVRMNLNKFLKHPGVYELFGLDFLMDDNLHLWYLETNLTPAMGKGNKMKEDLYNKLLEDILDVEFALQYGADLDEILKGTEFEWIFDGRKRGYERYHNVLSPDCL